MVASTLLIDVHATGVPASSLGTAVVGLGVWLAVLTGFVVRRWREPWRDDGRPVFQRLPDGRVRFSWGTAQGLARARRDVVIRPGDRSAPRSATTPGSAPETGAGR